MSDAIDAIVSMATTNALEVRRTAAATPVNGIFTPAAFTQLFIIAQIQPATGMQRVTAGRDMMGDRDGQYVNDVRVLYVIDELFTRTPTQEPDRIFYEGQEWVVFRVERWEDDGDVYFRALITRNVQGAS